MTRVFVGNLPMDIREREIDDIFYKYGRITDIQIKRPERPPAFAFVTFSHPRDADDAVYYRDGYDFDGGRLRVEMMRGGRDRRGPPPLDFSRRGGKSEFRVIVSGLPKSASWQDLKDHFKKSCDVSRTDVDRMGKGIVEFKTERDMEDGLRLDGSMFINPFSESKISVTLPGDDRRSGSRSRSRSPRRHSRSRDRSPPRRSRSRSRSRDRSPPRRSRSPAARDRSDSRERRRSRSASMDKADRADASPREP